jgi:hypothetical protein
MSADLESTLLSVWQQALLDKKKTVELDGETYTVRQTAKSKLKQVDFRFEDRGVRHPRSSRILGVGHRPSLFCELVFARDVAAR